MRTWFTVLGALLVGLSAGWIAARPTVPKTDLVQELVSCEIGNSGMTLHALRGFRAGSSQQSLDLLEVALSLHAVVLDEWLRELNPEHPEQVIEIMSAIAEYRAEHPFVSGDAEADAHVAAILSRRVVGTTPTR